MKSLALPRPSGSSYIKKMRTSAIIPSVFTLVVSITMMLVSVRNCYSIYPQDCAPGHFVVPEDVCAINGRIYDPQTGRFLSPDPVVSDPNDLQSYNRYSYVHNRPLTYVDPSGYEPVKNRAGTIGTFVNVMNTSPSRVGTHTGDRASATLLSFAKTEGFKPVTTPYFNEKPGRYVYTEKGGWVDMVHFLFYAGDAYQYKTDGEENPIGEAMQDGYHQERFDSITREESIYSYEDLPSDLFGADFAVNYFDPSSDKTLAEQITDYFDAKLKPTDPQNAPNYDNLPGSHNDLEGSPPSAQNETTVPMYISPDENGTD